jgi:hypothetical protein
MQSLMSMQIPHYQIIMLIYGIDSVLVILVVIYHHMRLRSLQQFPFSSKIATRSLLYYFSRDLIDLRLGWTESSPPRSFPRCLLSMHPQVAIDSPSVNSSCIMTSSIIFSRIALTHSLGYPQHHKIQNRSIHRLVILKNRTKKLYHRELHQPQSSCLL